MKDYLEYADSNSHTVALNVILRNAQQRFEKEMGTHHNH